MTGCWSTSAGSTGRSRSEGCASNRARSSPSCRAPGGRRLLGHRGGRPPRLLAFVVPAGQVSVDDVDTAAIREHVATNLPGHMRPERVVAVVRIPATVNGKIDKDALVHVWQSLSDHERVIVPPADDLEASVAELYRRVLETTQVSMLDTFTQLGGHSLLAFQLLDECLAKLHAQPDATELLAGTVRDVATSIRAAAERTS